MAQVAFKQLSFFGGPFAGKTTFWWALLALGIPVWETDDHRKALPGWDPALWHAWRPTHPRHAEWKRFDEVHNQDRAAAWKAGAVVIDHQPLAQNSILIYPGADALTARAEEYLDWVIASVQPTEQRGKLGRLSAGIHYWSNKLTAEDIVSPNRIKVSSVQEALDMVCPDQPGLDVLALAHAGKAMTAEAATSFKTRRPL